MNGWLDAAPPWLLYGLALSAFLSLVVAAVFVAGVRLSPGGRGSTARPPSGDERRRREIRQYLRDAGESFVEDRAVAGRRVAFYLPERDVAVTFDAETYFGLGNADTRAVLVEHELPGWQLGTRLPFETPDVGAAGGEGVDAVAAAFRALGLGEDATPAEVTAAYRDRVKDVHPDHGGDRESFRRIREAYATARAHAREDAPAR